MDFGKRLLALRKQKGLSQDELGGLIHVSRQTVSKWELGETTPEMDKLILLSDVFAVSLDKLIKGIEEPTNGRLSVETKNSIKKIFFILIIIIGAVIAVDIIVMIIYFIVNGFPA